MRKLNRIRLIIGLLFIGFGISKAQTNLVINPSFETYTACPTNTGGDVNKATGWDTCRGSADYFNICGTSSLFQVPKNLFGTQYPAHGNAYTGFITYNSGGPNNREIIIGQLSAPLAVSQKYYISFKVCRADSNAVMGYSSNKIGIKFTKVKQSYVQINNTAHYYSNTIITDTVNWTKIFGSFVTDSAYKYIMIGNFFDDSNTSVINDGSSSYAYYYMDEVCVGIDSAFTENYASNISQYEKDKEIDLYPNPANDFLFVKGAMEANIKIFNSQGIRVWAFEAINYNSIYINCSQWADGLYFIEAKNVRYKLIINH